MEGVMVPFLPTGFWLFSVALAILVLLIFLGFFIYVKKRLKAIAEDAATTAELVSKKEHAELSAEKQKLEADVESLREWLRKHEDELTRMLSERKKQEDIRGVLNDLEVEVDRKEGALKDMRNEAGELENNRHIISERVEKLKETEHDIDVKIGDMNEVSKKLKKEVNEKTKELSDRKEQVEEAKSLLREAGKAQIVHSELLAAKSALEIEIEKIKKTVDEQSRIAEKTKFKLNSEYEESIIKLDNLMHELKEIKEKVAIQERLEKEKAKVVRSLASEETVLKTLIKNHEKEMGDEKGTAASSKEKHSDLWHPISFPALKAAEGSLNEKDALDKTADYIKGQKLQFHDRTLNAFHTALKVSDISPIVVLAGISGTGKSELPRRYAEGMGLHFVILPVQPRWDSPQDLFGFYNYLEGRYKATELARAMVQFELYNTPDWPLPEGWNDDRSDRMLLVLLDEMNLARVEYYFSEFLSRLETRRGLDQKDEKQRANAEIALEMGSLGENETAIKLFPGHNILFAGTMNEDETTQALSDKVLDRACVLRFGRPNKFIKTEKPPAERKSSEQGVTYEQWNSWLRKENSKDEQDQINKWINQLNKAMEQLARPFGYRVALAIQSYVANYPDWVTNRMKNAMADQIEQRILPKIRGIEISESMDAINKIGSVIEACEDDKLIRAFNQGKSDKTTFIWRGIDRMEERD